MRESAAVEMEYAIPERSGETLIVPPVERLPSLVTVYDPGEGAAVFDVSLRDFRGKNVLLFFYSKADTPG